MLNILSAICFVTLLVTGIALAFSGNACSPAGRRGWTNAYLVFALLFSFAAGLGQRDMWPFSSWTMMVGLTPPATRTLPTLRIVGVDAGGNEYDIDYRAWQPLSLEEMYGWIRRNFFQLDPASQGAVARFLLYQSNRAREAAIAQGGLDNYHRVLGPFTAPTHELHPPLWNRSTEVPAFPLVGLRLYEESWDLQVPPGAPLRVTRNLRHEYPRR
jgi:hypothetical protein